MASWFGLGNGPSSISLVVILYRLRLVYALM